MVEWGSSQFWLQMQAEVVDWQFATKEWRNSWSISTLELKVISLHVEIIYSCIEDRFHQGWARNVMQVWSSTPADIYFRLGRFLHKRAMRSCDACGQQTVSPKRAYDASVRTERVLSLTTLSEEKNKYVHAIGELRKLSWFEEEK